MTTLRKIGPLRQLSLQCETPPPQQRRKSLKKQFSEDIPDEKLWSKVESSPRLKLGAHIRSKTVDKPPSIKIAWSDNVQKTIEEQFLKKEDSLITKKCKEIKRPITAKITKQHSLDKEAILYSRQELAEKFRQAWNEREKSKQNINIFLASSHKDKSEEESYDHHETDSLHVNENQESKPTCNPKILAPLQPEYFSQENNYKSIFKKQMRKSQSVCDDFHYSPTKLSEKQPRCSTIVVVPYVENKTNVHIAKETSEMKNENEPKKNFSSVSKKEEEENKEEHKVPLRPTTATSKRESFQKRINSAFNDSVKKESSFRPPLVRSTSVPSKPTEQKPKFLATKRRIRSAKRKDKTEKIYETLSGDEGEEKGVLRRNVSISNGEVETMVSLVSPSESEVEEEEEKGKESETKGPIGIKEDGVEGNKNESIKKPVKTVSFQQSTIHAVRSFSASFPARRGSVAFGMMAVNKTSSGVSKMLEKRAPSVNLPDDEERVAKRRLVRTKSMPQQLSFDDVGEKSQKDRQETEKGAAEYKEGTGKKEDETEENLGGEPKFESVKEKQCWELYKKMCGKGVNVSFDTILRGMLTPTEYRMRKRPSIVLGGPEETAVNESNVENC